MARSRKPAKPRDFKAEYARRKRNALAKGKTMQEARGHKNESAERKARRARVRAEHGISVERLSKLRRQARDRVVAGLGTAGTKNPVNVVTIDKGMRLLNRDQLNHVRALSTKEVQRRAFMSYEDLIDEYPEYENDDEINPFWYH